MDYYPLIRPLVFRLKEETAHHAALWALKHKLLPAQPRVEDARLAMKVAGLSFRNPIGLAAGFDKDAEAIAGLFRQGFGFVETGTVTPKPQQGNPRPRLFRLAADEAIINRMGFNNKGLVHYMQRLEAWQASRPRDFSGILGANIGRNKESPNDASDYLLMLEGVYGLSDYITVNISSPNTPGLREMQRHDILSEFLKALITKRTALAKASSRRIPLFLKVAPDIGQEEQESIAAAALAQRVDGLIVGNTTTGLRDRLKERTLANEQGGLSGKPLLHFSTLVLSNLYRLTGGRLPIIGAGGVASTEDAYAKIRAGASLVQIYSALIYKGFSLPSAIAGGLPDLLERDGLKTLAEAVGVDAGR